MAPPPAGVHADAATLAGVREQDSTSPDGVRVALTGWGHTSASVCDLEPVSSEAEVSRLVHSAGRRGVLARGLGRSYGDAAQNGGGRVLDMTGRRGVLGFDPATGVVDVEAGVSIDQLIREFLPRGWFVPVTPGTRQATVGGAIAADVHGKNHHTHGSFGDHVEALTLVTADGQPHRLTPTDPLFWATVGGMGLTGVIVRASVRLTPVETSTVLVETWRCPDLDSVMAAMADDDKYEYSVAWIDSLAKGAHLGRSVLTRGRFATRAELPARQRPEPLAFSARTLVTAPPGVPSGLLNQVTVAAFNEVWYRKAPRHREDEPQSVNTFFHPLDGVAEWNRIYGRRGLLQYQVLVPLEASETIREIAEAFSSHGLASFLSVLKRMGPGNPGMLSFPGPGWTLAIDVPAGDPEVGQLLDRLDESVVAVGGRSYFAKDARMRPATAHAMYPRLAEWNAIRQDVDPDGLFISDLARRLQL